jgi:hypothetical protein
MMERRLKETRMKNGWEKIKKKEISRTALNRAV